MINAEKKEFLKCLCGHKEERYSNCRATHEGLPCPVCDKKMIVYNHAFICSKCHEELGASEYTLEIGTFDFFIVCKRCVGQTPCNQVTASEEIV